MFTPTLDIHNMLQDKVHWYEKQDFRPYYYLALNIASLIATYC
jgi:hypothetical protein